MLRDDGGPFGCLLITFDRHDTSPSTFDQPISSVVQAIHDTKRAKLSESSEKSAIGFLIEKRAYTAIEEVIKDLDAATVGVADELQDAYNKDQGRYVARDVCTNRKRPSNIRRELEKLVQREMFRRPEIFITLKDIKDEPSEEEDVKTRFDVPGDNVLTLLANTQPPKQLFTSLCKPLVTSRPLDEPALPNGITTARVMPQHSIDEEVEKPARTFKDVFAPPTSLPPLALPKQSRHTATRSSSVNWYNPAETEPKAKSSKADGYTKQPLTTGQWLKYNVAPSPTQLASPETKRKQRDRALSVGESQAALSREALETHNQAKEDALFRSLYSNFAPSRDDSSALVPEQQKNRQWWDKYGETRYVEIVGIRDDGMQDTEETVANGIADEESIDEEQLERDIANWKMDDPLQEMQESSVQNHGVSQTEIEADDVLKEISDLLETLHSHQRIRNLTLPNNVRPTAGQNQQSTDVAGSPTQPSTAEFDVYEMLKNQLTLIISNLPPYLLSKLDGDKLGALKISTRIRVESRNSKGILEESEASASARRAATPSVASAGATQAPSAYPSRSSSYLQASTPAQQYPRAGYGPSTAPRPAANSSYLQNPQYSNRPASSNYSSGTPRPAYTGQGGYPAQAAAAASTPRYNYGQQYSQQQSQSSYGSYQNGYRPYSVQNVNSYNYNGQMAASQTRAPSTPAQTSPPAYRGPASEYPQRAVPPQGYGYGSAQNNGRASPHSQSRPAFSNQTPQGSGQQRPQLYHHSSSQYQSQTPGSPQVNGTASNGSPAPVAHMTSDEQAAAMSRQKAQLAEVQSRQGSGTPQPGSRQYTPKPEGIQQNGTAVPQQNGVVAG